MHGPGMTPPREVAGEGLGQGRPGGHVAVMAGVRDELDRVLEPLLRPLGPYALLGYPRGRNVGEYLLWLGTVEQLRRRGIVPVYVSSRTDYARAELAARLGDGGTILLAGGGNLGDLWPPEQEFRERVVQEFPGARIVQLPQSVHFRSSANLERAQKIFSAHPDLSLLLRDPISYEQALDAFGERGVVACPDIAFGMSPLDEPPPGEGVLWLGRTDRESRHPPVDVLPPWVRRWDWAIGHGRPFAWAVVRHIAVAMAGDGNRRHGLPVPGHALVRAAGLRQARAQLRRGVAGLTSACVVITDRFHGHVLACLLGMPQVVLDNGDGKVHAFVSAWTGGSPLVHLATSADEALEKATALAAGGLP